MKRVLQKTKYIEVVQVDQIMFCKSIFNIMLRIIASRHWRLQNLSNFKAKKLKSWSDKKWYKYKEEVIALDYLLWFHIVWNSNRITKRDRKLIIILNYSSKYEKGSEAKKELMNIEILEPWSYRLVTHSTYLNSEKAMQKILKIWILSNRRHNF